MARLKVPGLSLHFSGQITDLLETLQVCKSLEADNPH